MVPKDLLCRNNWYQAGKSCARIYPVFLHCEREIGEKQDNGRRATDRAARIILQPRNCHHCCFFSFLHFVPSLPYMAYMDMHIWLHISDFPYSSSSLKTCSLSRCHSRFVKCQNTYVVGHLVTFCQNLSLKSDSTTTFPTYEAFSQCGSCEKMLVQGEGSGSYYHHVIPNITSFVLHHRTKKRHFCEGIFGWAVFMLGIDLNPLPFLEGLLCMKAEGY